jgi:RHS repeat-associated protein
MTDESDPDVDLLFSYTGRLLDESTGLQSNWRRWYDPAIGRWLSEDPIGFTAGDANLNRYVGNDPAGNVDPSGLTAFRGFASRGSDPGFTPEQIDRILNYGIGRYGVQLGSARRQIRNEYEAALSALWPWFNRSAGSEKAEALRRQVLEIDRQIRALRRLVSDRPELLGRTIWEMRWSDLRSNVAFRTALEGASRNWYYQGHAIPSSVNPVDLIAGVVGPGLMRAAAPSLVRSLAATNNLAQVTINRQAGLTFQQQVDARLGAEVQPGTAMVGTTPKGAQYTTISDYMFVSNGGLVEVKAGQYISYSPQLQAQVSIGRQIGVPSRFYIAPNSTVSGNVLRNYGQGNVIRYNPATRTFSQY